MAKLEKCPTCGEKVEQPPNAKRKKIYCNDTCRSVAWHRRKSLAKKKMAETIKPVVGKRVNIEDLTKPSNGKAKDLTKPPSKSNYAINTMPVREKGESALDFAARKNEWKRKQSLQK